MRAKSERVSAQSGYGERLSGTLPTVALYPPLDAITAL